MAIVPLWRLAHAPLWGVAIVPLRKVVMFLHWNLEEVTMSMVASCSEYWNLVLVVSTLA